MPFLFAKIRHILFPANHRLHTADSGASASIYVGLISTIQTLSGADTWKKQALYHMCGWLTFAAQVQTSIDCILTCITLTGCHAKRCKCHSCPFSRDTTHIQWVSIYTLSGFSFQTHQFCSKMWSSKTCFVKKINGWTKPFRFPSPPTELSQKLHFF